MTSEEMAFLSGKKGCFSFCFSNLFSCLEILPKNYSVWLLEKEEKWLDNMWENGHSSGFQLQWKLDFPMNCLNLEKLADLVRPGLEKHNTQLRKAMPLKSNKILDKTYRNYL